MKSTFLERGGLWVICQGVFMLGVFGLSLTCRSTSMHKSVIIAGCALMIVGAYFGIAGALALNKHLTPFPKPKAHAVLVRHGIYARVRHPLYTSVALASLGWAIAWHSWPAVVFSLLLIPFFAAKAQKEEQWLRERFPEYSQYTKDTWRFIPWIY